MTDNNWIGFGEQPLPETGAVWARNEWDEVVAFDIDQDGPPNPDDGYTHFQPIEKPESPRIEPEDEDSLPAKLRRMLDEYQDQVEGATKDRDELIDDVDLAGAARWEARRETYAEIVADLETLFTNGRMSDKIESAVGEALEKVLRGY